MQFSIIQFYFLMNAHLVLMKSLSAPPEVVSPLSVEEIKQ